MTAYVNKFIDLIKSVVRDPALAPFGDKLYAFLAANRALIPYAILIACLVVGLFGKRWFGFFRTLGFAGAGFVLGIHTVAPLFADRIPGFPSLILAIGLAVVCAVLSKAIYNGVYVFGIGFFVWDAFFNGHLVNSVAALEKVKGNMLVSIIIAVVVVVIALLLKKFVEMLATSILSGMGIAYVGRAVFNYTKLLPATAPISVPVLMLIVGAVIALIFFVVQFSTRERY